MAAPKVDDKTKKKKEEVALSDIVTLFGSYAALPPAQHNQDGAKNYNSKIPTLLNWLNSFLEPKNITMTEMKGFHRGLELIYVLEGLTHTNLVTKNVNPNTWTEQQTNCELVLRFAKHLGISIDNITGDELNADNVPKVLLLIVRATLQVHASESALDPKELKKKKKIEGKEPPTNVEIKLDQATYDGILKQAAAREDKRVKDEKDQDSKKRKGPTAMELIAENQATGGAQKFYVVLEDGSKQAVAFKALQSLEETVQKVAEKRGFKMSDYVICTVDGRPQLSSTKMAEIKGDSIKFLPKTSTQIVGGFLDAEKQRVLAELLGGEDVIVLSGKDVIAEEAAERTKRRLAEGPRLQASSDMSPALRELERQHKLLLKQLKVSQIKTVDKVTSDEIEVKDPAKVDPSNLSTVYVNLNTFSDKLGQRDAKYEPESFFKGLVTIPSKKEIEKIAKAEEAEEVKTSRRHKEEEQDDDDDDDTSMQYPATFLIQLETGGRLQVPFLKSALVKTGLEKVAAKNGIKIDEWMYVTLSGQPVDPNTTTMGKVPGFSIMCVKKA